MTLIELSKLNILSLTGIVSHCFRWLGWQIIKLLASLVNGIEVAINKIYDMNSFFFSEQINEFISRYEPIIWSILAISILILGYKIILNKKKDRQNIPINILFSILVVISLPTFMLKINELTNLVVNDVKENYTSSANILIKESLYDLYALDKNEFNFNKKNNISELDILNIDINEKFEVNSETKNKDIFENKLQNSPEGEMTPVKLEKNWIKMDENYYRYNIDFISIIIGLSTTGITLLCVGFKVARLIFELAFNKLFAMLFAFADIEDDNKKLKAILKQIFSTFAVIMATAILLKLYIMFNSWLTLTVATTESGIGFTPMMLAKFIVQIGASFAVIDGPNIIERILGIDAGLKSGLNTMLGTYTTMQTMKSGAIGASNGVKIAGKGIDGLTKVGAVGVGGAVGLFSDNKNSSNSLAQQQESHKNKENSNNINSKETSLSDEMKDQKNKNMETKSNENNSSNNGIVKSDNDNFDTEAQGLKNNETLQGEMNNKNANSNNENNGFKPETLQDDMKNFANGGQELKNSETLQDEINNKNANSNNENNGFKPETLQDDMKNFANEGQVLKNSETLQGEMNNKGANSNNENNGFNPETLQDNMKNFANEGQELKNSETLQGEMDNKNVNSNNENNGFKSQTLQDNKNNIASNGQEVKNDAVRKDGMNKSKDNNNNFVEDRNTTRPAENKKDNFISRKANEIKQMYNLGKNTTERYNIPNNYRNLKDKINNKMEDK